MIQADAVFSQMPKIIGHRGASGHAPENTLAALRKAAEITTSFVEIDVTITRDSVAVIQHDSDVRRCTNGTGPILLKSLEDVRALDAGSWFAPEFEGERIPTLKEAVGLVQELGLGLNLEIKPTAGWQIPTTKQVAKELLDCWPDALPLLISSFAVECLIEVRRYLPDVPLGYLTSAIPPDWERRMAEYDCASLHCERHYVTKDHVDAIKSAGYRVLVYTVNDPEEAKKLLDWGVDAVITDFPDRIFSKLGQ
ncbi:glycerophosphoryl diester phosphodiesterase [Sneathiella litorea]|uniref:Glycerophosphoryl diester phosphodiesterase n=1 Tax=Sneathiella litorea TaxID=2606216 RepID=A0A6L8W9W3_9PROT|nr:glycerophosphoryl diester phosphodiesterase [Sneathiella litorea]MZR31841.1 glycerophosphoryl diester phosphodiesterase [Sneathiella litorea]